MDKQVKLVHQHVYMCVCVSALPAAKTRRRLLQGSVSHNGTRKQT